MIRFAWFGIRLLLLMVVAVWLSAHPGAITIRWLGYLIETSMAALAAMLFLLAGLAFLGGRILRDVMHIPQRWARHREVQTGRKGRRALTSGLVAVASGDPVAAKRSAVQTEATIVDPVLSHLLNAEALILSGETDAAESQFELLLGRDDTRVIGHRGLIEVALARGDTVRAYSRAKQARAVMGKSPWLMRTLVDLAARNGDLDEANAALLQAIKAKSIVGAEATRWQCTIFAALARRADAAGDARTALAHAETALGHDEGFVPAAILAARLLAAGDRVKSAERVLDRAWARQPHPELVAAWHSIGPGANGAPDDPTALAAWMARLKQAHPANTDAALAFASALVDARLWTDARRELETLLSTPAASRALVQLARLEQEEGANLPAAVGFYRRAAELSAGLVEPAWVCRVCGHPAPDWSELCPACGAFAQLASPQDERGDPPARNSPVSLPGIGFPLTAQTRQSA